MLEIIFMHISCIAWHCKQIEEWKESPLPKSKRWTTLTLNWWEKSPSARKQWVNSITDKEPLFYPLHRVPLWKFMCIHKYILREEKWQQSFRHPSSFELLCLQYFGFYLFLKHIQKTTEYRTSNQDNIAAKLTLRRSLTSLLQA